MKHNYIEFQVLDNPRENTVYMLGGYWAQTGEAVLSIASIQRMVF